MSTIEDPYLSCSIGTQIINKSHVQTCFFQREGCPKLVFLARGFDKGAIAEEIIPTLDLPRPELEEFAGDVIERFQNPAIRHELKSIALNSISKFQVRVLPSILEYHKRYGKLPTNLLYSLAALILFYKGEWRGETMPINDTPEVLAFFKDAWRDNDISTATQQVLGNQNFWKSDLRNIEGMMSLVERHMREIATNGF